MKFNEKEFIELPKFHNCFIYFLIKDEEVIYVGQTHNGIVRPLAHLDKPHDKTYIIYCEPFELDALENYYIEKYRPYYNKSCNNTIRYGIEKSRKLINKKINKKITKDDFDLIIKKLGIIPHNYSGVKSITIFEYYDIIKYMEK